MMLLTIDVGNTNIVFGLYEGEKLKGSCRLATVSTATSDEIGTVLCAYLERFGFSPQDVDAAIIGSVVPQVMYALTSAIIKYFGVSPLAVGTDVSDGLQFHPRCYETGRLGTDRAVSCVAALRKYGAPLIVLDFGTATTMDVLDEHGVYLGGAIAPGLQVSLDALVSRTAMLPRVELVTPETVLGRNTVEQIQAGVVAGYVGNITFIIHQAKLEMGCENVSVVATGGLSRMIAEGTTMINIVDATLTLDGLRMIYEENRGAK